MDKNFLETKRNLTVELASVVKLALKEERAEQQEALSSDVQTAVCNVVESIFIHGLKDPFFLKGSSRQAKYPEPNFWPFISKFVLRSVKAQIADLNQIKNEVGRARAWLRIALNERVMENYVSALHRDLGTIRTFYQRYAYIRDSEQIDIMISYMRALARLPFKLAVNSSLLNSWTPTPLRMAGYLDTNRHPSLNAVDEDVALGVSALEFDGLDESPDASQVGSPTNSSQFMSKYRSGRRGGALSSDDDASSVYSHPSLMDAKLQDMMRISESGVSSGTPLPTLEQELIDSGVGSEEPCGASGLHNSQVVVHRRGATTPTRSPTPTGKPKVGAKSSMSPKATASPRPMSPPGAASPALEEVSEVEPIVSEKERDDRETDVVGTSESVSSETQVDSSRLETANTTVDESFVTAHETDEDRPHTPSENRNNEESSKKIETTPVSSTKAENSGTVHFSLDNNAVSDSVSVAVEDEINEDGAVGGDKVPEQSELEKSSDSARSDGRIASPQKKKPADIQLGSSLPSGTYTESYVEAWRGYSPVGNSLAGRGWSSAQLPMENEVSTPSFSSPYSDADYRSDRSMTADSSVGDFSHHNASSFSTALRSALLSQVAEVGSADECFADMIKRQSTTHFADTMNDEIEIGKMTLEDKRELELHSDAAPVDYVVVDTDDCVDIQVVGGCPSTSGVSYSSQARYAFINKCPGEVGLDSQNFQCHTCHKGIGLMYGSFRVCTFDGAYYCNDCHRNDEAIIPARLLFSWDLAPKKVSRASKAFLEHVADRPLIDMAQTNASLYDYVEDMQTVLTLRRQLSYLAGYLLTCKESVAEDLRKRLWPKEYLYNDVNLFSINDLINTSTGVLQKHVQSVIAYAKNHVQNCRLCTQKGFICEICDDRKIIYPFQIETTHRCNKCYSVFHLTCSKGRPCPKCLRREKYYKERKDSNNFAADQLLNSLPLDDT